VQVSVAVVAMQILGHGKHQKSKTPPLQTKGGAPPFLTAG
jgi:hypothetical protein